MTTQEVTSSEIKHKHQMHPNSLANLKPYSKGENGHKGGYNLTERLYHSLNKPLREPAADAPSGEQIVYNTIKGAIELVPVAFRETWDRSEGKAPDRTQLLGDIMVQVVFRNLPALSNKGSEFSDPR